MTPNEDIHPYQVGNSPFGDVASLTITFQHIENEADRIQLELEAEILKSGGTAALPVVKTSITDLTKGNVEGISQFFSGIKDSNTITLTTSNYRLLDDRLKSKNNDRLYGTSVNFHMQFRDKPRDIVTYEAILFKVYGLNDFDPLKCSALLALEEFVLDKSSINADKVIVYNGTVDEALDAFKVDFGISSWSFLANKDWRYWFKYRFLKAFLTFLGAIREKQIDLKGMYVNPDKSPELLAIACELVSSMYVEVGNSEPTSIWNLENSPWPDYVLNSNPETVYEYLKSLRTAIEMTSLRVKMDRNGSIINPNTGYKNEYNESGQKEGETTEDYNRRKVAERAEYDATVARYDPVKYAAGYGQGSTPDYMKRFLGPLAPVTLQTAMDGGYGTTADPALSTVHPGNGTGGNVNALPDPKGDGSWEAHKELIVAAAKMAGVDPGLMATMASIESTFRAKVKNPKGSATGLYQFMPGTWKDMLRNYGGKYGISPNADRRDPKANALMGAEYLKENYLKLKGMVKREVTDTDLYIGHLLGAGGMHKFLTASPDADASALMGVQANSNKEYFYGPGGSHISVAAAYKLIDKKVNTHRSQYAAEARKLAGMSGPTPTQPLNTASTPTMAPDPTGGSSAGTAPTVPPAAPGAAEVPPGSPAPTTAGNAPTVPGAAPGTTPTGQPAPTVPGQATPAGTLPRWTPMPGANSPTVPGQTTPAATNSSVSNPAEIAAVLKSKVQHPGVDIKNLRGDYAAKLAALIKDVEQTTGRKMVITSGFRPTTEAAKAALQSTGSSQEAVRRADPAGVAAGRVGSTYGSMHGRGEAVDIKYVDVGDYKNMNRLSAADKAVWNGLVEKHGLRLPMKSGKVIEWWHVEPNSPVSGKRGDLGLRDAAYMNLIKSNALIGGTITPSPEKALGNIASTVNDPRATPPAPQGGGGYPVAAPPPNPSQAQTIRGQVSTGSIPGIVAANVPMTTPRQALPNANIGNSEGINQALNRNVDGVAEQKSAMAQQVAFNTTASQTNTELSSRSLTGVVDILGKSLETQKSMDTKLETLVQLLRAKPNNQAPTEQKPVPKVTANTDSPKPLNRDTSKLKPMDTATVSMSKSSFSSMT